MCFAFIDVMFFSWFELFTANSLNKMLLFFVLFLINYTKIIVMNDAV